MLGRFLQHRLFQDSLVLLGVQVSGYVLPLITLPYLTHVLGPDNFGLLALGTALVLYFSVVVEYGFAVTGPRQVAIVQDQPEKVSRIYSTIMMCKVLLLAGSLSVLGILVFLVPSYREYWPLYLVSYLQVLGWGLSPNWLLQGMQRIRYVAYCDYSAKVVSVALIFLLVKKESDYLIAAALQSGGFLIAACFGLVVTFRKLRIRLVVPTWEDMKQAIREAWPVFLSSANMTVVTSSNTMILGATASNAQVGYFSAAQRLMIAARSLNNPINAAVFPHMSKLVSENPAKALRFFRTRLSWTVVPFLLMGAGVLLLAGWITRLLYGPDFGETETLLRIMALTPFFHSVAMCVGVYYMLAFGFEKAMERIIRLAMVGNFVMLGVTMQLMAPVRAVSLTTTLVDLLLAGSYFAFYLRRTRERQAEPA